MVKVNKSVEVNDGTDAVLYAAISGASSAILVSELTHEGMQSFMETPSLLTFSALAVVAGSAAAAKAHSINKRLAGQVEQ